MGRASWIAAATAACNEASGTVLSRGTRLGVYEVASLLGAGGMGEVYRAHDPRLKRDVALKILPATLAANPELLARFEREAHLLASINHPNIAAIYGLEDSGPQRALVMELVDGLTLATRLAQGRMPLEEALPVARQIAEALEFAHERGIVHRDLKPSNIKLRPDGVVKVLDFGLARVLQGETEETDQSLSPTITVTASRDGLLLGTPGYMSPEQARGRRVDRRADIWAFGCVLFEMLSGRPAFVRETASDSLAAVLHLEPDWSALPAGTGWRLRELLRRCLAKDARQRLHDIADARLEIESLIASGSESAGAESPRLPWGSMPRPRALLLGGVATVALVAVTVAGRVLSGAWPGRGPAVARPMSMSIIPTEGSEVGAPAISPDGRRIAYRARRADGMPMLWVRDLGSFEARALAGTENAFMPFWSPDSRQLGFWAYPGVIKRIPAVGGPVQVVVGPASSRGSAWAADDTILYQLVEAHLARVAATGGRSTPVTTVPGRDWQHLWPAFLPDQRRFLFTLKMGGRPAEEGEQGIYLGSLDSPKTKRLLPDMSSAVYAPPGFVVFARDGMLTAAPFDAGTGTITGEPLSLRVPVEFDSTYFGAAISAAADGTLAVRPPPACAMGFPDAAQCEAELRFLDRAGRITGTAARQRYTYYMALAPDDHRVAALTIDPRSGDQEIWLVDMQDGTRRPMTPARLHATAPVWSPDGSRLAYAFGLPGDVDDIHVLDVASARSTPLIRRPETAEHPLAWSHDGAYLLVDSFLPRDHQSLQLWSFASRTLTPFAEGRCEEAAFSPDDRYVAYTSRISGRHEVYVTTFPDHGQTWPLTTEGGHALHWRADGRELLVATTSGHIVAYPVSTDHGFSAGRPEILIRDVGLSARYSTATLDHARILVRANPDAAKDKGEIRLLFNWAGALQHERTGTPAR